LLPLTSFVFHGARYLRPDMDRGRLEHMVAVHLDHYRLDANFKHGPQPMSEGGREISPQQELAVAFERVAQRSGHCILNGLELATNCSALCIRLGPFTGV